MATHEFTGPRSDDDAWPSYDDFPRPMGVLHANADGIADHVARAPVARFKNRAAGGRELATKLTHLRGGNVIVLGLPRGGVPVAYEVARALRTPLGVLNVRKLGVPWHQELAMGAIASGGVCVLNNAVLVASGITKSCLEDATTRRRYELDHRARLYAGGRPDPDLCGKIVVLVDDGIATGASARAAIRAVRAKTPARVVLAVPVASESLLAEVSFDVDELVCVHTPPDLYALGLWYESFAPLTDSAVQAMLARGLSSASAAAAATSRPRETEKPISLGA